MFAASSWPWMPKTPHMALTYHGGVIVSSELEDLSGLAYLFETRGPASLARCTGHRGFARSLLGGDPDRPRHGLRDPHRRRHGLPPPLAGVLGGRRLHPGRSELGQRRLLPGAAGPEPPVQARRRRALRQPVAAVRRHRPVRRRRRRPAPADDPVPPPHGRGRPDRPAPPRP